MAAEKPVLQVSDLNFTVQGQDLLKNLTLSLKAGKLLVVLGCNGAGKSTLLKHIAGEFGNLRNVELFGLPLPQHPARPLARKRAVLPQSTPMTFGYEVQDVVMLGRIPHQQKQRETSGDRQIVLDCLRKVGLAGYEHRNCLTLSGGELQRVHLARVLAQLAGTAGEKVLLLDEPTSSLDLSHQHQTLQIARDLCASGVGVMAVLHDLNLASQYADQIVLMKQGCILAQGSPADVLRPEVLFEAYGYPVQVIEHPVLGCPLVVSAR
ncbi:heme ABC transporter ATP-binding protein [Deinococcus cellulosilyticus]|uniref:heme ABC transporter ATP-binding protein n=1 Tax=Deinococcus cellulosilyticus TaxID=401558 RepID=UPI001FEA838C|nr:heme ABC transporter ATP-binding protein [Deinococcus cellulosilyticus]